MLPIRLSITLNEAGRETGRRLFASAQALRIANHTRLRYLACLTLGVLRAGLAAGERVPLNLMRIMPPQGSVSSPPPVSAPFGSNLHGWRKRAVRAGGITFRSEA